MISYWWCPHCKREVDSGNVTFEEKHDTCGYPVTVIEIDSDYDGVVNWKREVDSGNPLECIGGLIND